MVHTQMDDLIRPSQLNPEEAAKHLETLRELDESIVSILKHASESLAVLNSVQDNTKEEFSEHVGEFYDALEKTTVGLRSETSALIKSNVLPTAGLARAEWVGVKQANDAVEHAKSVINRL
ncbi:hypothetical protein V1512DRAFT_255988 [Lipomyces arxii]|uniref:uncharacterized protein n=1 Tax=Lipomyces arxii TaxID=56418 RepID=UPI0034CE813A